MNEQQHADRIRQIVKELNTATREATAVGLTVDFDIRQTLTVDSARERPEVHARITKPL
jgi:hypothetical protein